MVSPKIINTSITRFGFPRFFLILAILAAFGSGSALFAWSPGTGSPSAVQDFTVDTTNRFDVLSYYNCVYNASESYAAHIGWTGSVGSGIPGTTADIFKDDVRRRINFYRALAGLPADIVFDATDSSMDQSAALMFAANLRISHAPDATWTFYTTTAGTAAGSSNIGYGTGMNIYGPPAVDAYMIDFGTGNEVVGHRRWLLYSRQQTMGTGDIPPTTVVLNGTTYNNVTANAIWILGPFKSQPLLKAVSWPNAGYAPLPLVPARWSLSYSGADFSAATVTMQQSGTNVGVAIISNAVSGVGENTLVWVPTGLPSSLSGDATYTVGVSGVKISGTQTSFSYNVTLFDPNVLGAAMAISGTNAPYTSGGNYTFNAIPSADAYQLRVSTNSTAQWTEGAEDSPVPQIQVSTTGTYALRQSAVVRTGSKAFQLMFPDTSFSDQSFTITRDVVPGATSQLQFYDLMRYASATTTLSAQVSTDNGSTWTALWSRSGVNSGSSADWDSSFRLVSQSLGSYAGQLIKIRFLLHFSGGSGFVYNPSDSSNPPQYFGFFVDDVTVTNAVELVNTTVTTLSGTATSFRLDATTAGGSLVAGTPYSLRIRPSVGLRWYGDSTITPVTAQAPLKFSDWVTTLYPSVTGGVNGDYDHDGLTNGVEYAFGLNPMIRNSLSVLPQPAIASGSISVTFNQPDGVTGVTYGAEWSSDMMTWNAITDSGSGMTHIFLTSTAGKERAFFRLKVVIQP